MAMYDNLGVPVLDFHNPAGSIFYPKGLYTYAIGNTRGRDVLETFGTKKGQHLDLLLLASGDVRHLLFTISELSLRKPAYQPNSISFHINDYDPSVVARNVVILELVDTINPDVADDIDFLWNVWYNMTLSKAHIDRLREVLTSLIERNFDGDKSFLKFQASGNVLQECRNIWIDWMELRLNDIHSVKRERNQVMAKKSLDKMINTLSANVMSQVMMAPWDLRDVDVFSTESSFCQEIEHWFREGSTNDELAAINPTLIRPFVHKWRVHYGACAFEGYLPFQRYLYSLINSLRTIHCSHYWHGPNRGLIPASSFARWKYKNFT